jgi:hypothetical protein
MADTPATSAPAGSPATADSKVGGNRFTRALKLAAFSIAPVALLLVLGHCTADLLTHRELAFETDSLTGVSRYRMRVGRLPWSHESVTTLNTLGFPDVEYATLGPKDGCVHVVFTGDSFTFGDVTDGDKTWVSLVRERLATHHPGRCVRVFNIAAPMTTIEHQIKRVRETVDVLKPDYVILGQYQNDLVDLTMFGGVAYRPATDTAVTTNWGDRLRQTIPGFDSPLPRLVTYEAFKLFVERNIRVDILRRWSILADSSNVEQARWLTGIYGGIYDTLMTELRARKIGVAVVIMPSKFDLMAGRYPEGAYFEDLARRHAVPALSVYNALDARRVPMPYYTFDGHLNERGNRIVADTVYRWLTTASTTPFPALQTALGAAVPPRRVTEFPR